MRALHFLADAGSPGAALGLQREVGAALRPFQQFLAQAVHGARRRQVRYRLRWAKLPRLHSLQLTALDARLLVPRPTPGWGEPPPPPPREILDAEGAPLRVLGAAERDAETWVLRVEGRPADGPMCVGGEEVEVERLPDLEGVQRLVDAAGRSFALAGGLLRVEVLPAEGPLVADTGVRFGWRPQRSDARAGRWIRLLPPAEVDASDVLDPRAAFCEDGVDEVWTQERHDPKACIRVLRVDRERYELLLDRLPPEGSELFLPVDVRNLELQRRALRQLAEAPLPHHRGLLRLCEHPGQVRWPEITPRRPERWYFLTDPSRDGTDEQRRFVEQALGSPDLALLEGPPGSGKTTAICELIRQCVHQGERVLLCASTHVAIDNVLERILEERSHGGEPAVDAVRVGKLDRVDPLVQRCQLDERVEALVEAFRRDASKSGLGDEELRAMAERAVIMAASLTCGTTMGIAAHPLFRDRDRDFPPWERPIAAMPHWDVLIVDEASKTTVQELLVPAMMARRWVIVGDVRQLPPFTDRADLVANLRALVDPNDREIFPPDLQRARLLLWRLGRPGARQARWLLVERPGVLAALEQELATSRTAPSAVRVVARRGPAAGPVEQVSAAEVQAGEGRALLLAAAAWVLVGTDLIGEVAAHLPSTLLAAGDLLRGGEGLAEAHPLLLRTEAFRAEAGPLREPLRERGETIATHAELQEHERGWLERHDWAGELAWRLTRVHELRRSADARERNRMKAELERLLPALPPVHRRVEEIQDVGLPSALEVLQEGIGAERADRQSALTVGLVRRQLEAFGSRFVRLSFQHRMHPEIAALPREMFYGGQALHDANTVAQRDQDLGWDFDAGAPRRAWLDVRGHEKEGVNRREIEAMLDVLARFLAWAERKGPPRRGRPRAWEVACLCFYQKQEAAIREMLQALTGDRDRQTRFAAPSVEITCGVVDRFQGREADLVLLSMRNTRRTGFLDSPGRLNVGITRARQQLVIVGDAAYFAGCRISELEELARRTPRWAIRAGAAAQARRARNTPGVTRRGGRHEV